MKKSKTNVQEYDSINIMFNKVGTNRKIIVFYCLQKYIGFHFTPRFFDIIFINCLRIL